MKKKQKVKMIENLWYHQLFKKILAKADKGSKYALKTYLQSLKIKKHNKIRK